MSHGADWPIRSSFLVVAAATMAGLALGFAGYLTPVTFFALVAALLSGAWWWFSRGGSRQLAEPPLPTPARLGIAVLVALTVFALAAAVSHPPLAYDSLLYHLFFPARWLQLHRITIIPTPFGDEAGAYEPGNGELVFFALMAPFRSDVLARAGQVPFYALSGALVWALARQLGVRPGPALYAPLLLLVSPLAVKEAPTALVDLMWTTAFLGAFYFAIRTASSGERADAILCGLCLGLFCGTKYAAILYLPVFVPFLLASGIRRQVVWIAGGTALLAGPWYVRNWIAAGSPIYPAGISLVGHTVWHGAYGRAAMVGSVFHNEGWVDARAAVAHAFGPAVFLATTGLTGVGLVRHLVQQRSVGWSFVLTIGAAIGLVPIFWLGVPYNTEIRFLLPSVALMCAAAPVAFGFGGGIDLILHIAATVAVAWQLGGIIPAPYRLLFAGCTAGALGLEAVLSRLTRHRTRALCLATLALGLALGRWSLAACPDGCALLANLTPPVEVLPTWRSGWQWMDGHLDGARIAYAGTNAPYPLLGPHFANIAIYVNIDAHPSWRFDDYDRARPLGSGLAPTVKPAFERQDPDMNAWLANLATARIDTLVVVRLSSFELSYLSHDAAGFPVEETWAAAHPNLFRLQFANPDVHVYALSR